MKSASLKTLLASKESSNQRKQYTRIMPVENIEDGYSVEEISVGLGVSASKILAWCREYQDILLPVYGEDGKQYVYRKKLSTLLKTYPGVLIDTKPDMLWFMSIFFEPARLNCRSKESR